MTPTDDSPAAWRLATAGALLALMVVAAYLPLGHNEFVNFDDDSLILGNAALDDLSPARLGDILRLQLFTPHYKPLVNLSWAAELRLFGPDPWIFHRHNLLLHLVNALLVLALVARLAPLEPSSRERWAAALAVAAIWALHPMKVESVAWATERKDVLFAALYLAALLAHLRWLDRRRPFWLGLGSLLALAAMLSKAAAITLLPALFLLDLARGRHPRLALLTEKLPYLAATMLALYLYGLLPGPGAAGAGLALLAGGEPADRLAQAAHRHLAFAGRWLAPVDLAVLYPVPDFLLRPGWARLAGYALAHLAVAAALARALRRAPRAAAAGIFFSLTLLPSLAAPISTTNYLSDRYLYLPSLGLSALVVLAATTAWRRRAAAQPALLAAAILLCLLLATLSFRQVRVWRDSETLWSHVLAVQPPHPYAYNNRGAARRDRGNDRAALADFSRALELKPDYAAALANRAGVLRRRGRSAEALTHLDQALALTPLDGRLYRARGLVHARLGRLEEALTDYDRAIELDPTDAAALYQRSAARHRTGDLAGARADIERALAALSRPTAAAHLLQATIQASQGDLEAALADADRALELDPANPVAYNNRGFLRLRLGDPAAALVDLDRALSLRPGYPLALRSRGDALSALGRSTEACAAWRQSARGGAPAVASRLARCPPPDSASAVP